MAVTSNVYTDTGRLAYWGIFQQGKATTWTPTVPFFVLLCSTDATEFQAGYDKPLSWSIVTYSGPYSYTVSYGGLMEGGSGYEPVEVATGNGYTKGGQFLSNVSAQYDSGDLIMRANEVRWTATGAGFSAKSALLCYQWPVQFSRFANSGAFGYDAAILYASSFAVAMIDFGGTITASAGVDFVLEWHPDGIMRWRLA